MADQKRVYSDLDEWAEAMAEAVIANGGYVPPDAPLLWPPGTTQEESEELHNRDNADCDCDESAL